MQDIKCGLLSWLSKTARLGAIGAAFLAGSCVHSPPLGEVAKIEASQPMRDRLAAASTVLVYEGLPHQTKEVPLYQAELARARVIQIHGYPFYLPAVPLKDAAEMKDLLANQDHYQKYSGPKTCGGFHPDYALFWETNGVPHHVLICFGCGEALFSDGKELLPYDLKHKPLYQLRETLARYRNQRPQPQP